MKVPGLKKNRQFRLVYSEGKREVGDKLTICFLKREAEGLLPGFVASKKRVGNAVRRNRAKRLMREGFIGLRERFKEKGLWIVFIASQDMRKTSFHELKKDMESSLLRAGLIS
jgi:ribonuclease P protein component